MLIIGQIMVFRGLMPTEQHINHEVQRKNG